MNASNFVVNCVMRARRSSSPKLILGSWSAIDGASADWSGGRVPLIDREGSKPEDIVMAT